MWNQRFHADHLGVHHRGVPPQQRFISFTNGYEFNAVPHTRIGAGPFIESLKKRLAVPSFLAEMISRIKNRKFCGSRGAGAVEEILGKSGRYY